MRDFVSFLGMPTAELRAIVDDCLRLRREGFAPDLRDKAIASIFFSDSLRTRLSCDVAVRKMGGISTVVAANQDLWALDFSEGAPMLGRAQEHVQEAVATMSLYFDALGVRAVGDYRASFEEYRDDRVLNAFVKYAAKPVINLNSAMEHPCQAIADMAALREAGDPKGKSFVLTWAPNVEPRGWGVAQSALLAAAHSGMDVTLCHPPGYALEERYLAETERVATRQGGRFAVTHDQSRALADAEVVYVKSWCARQDFGPDARRASTVETHGDWLFAADALRPGAAVMHCLPVRRDVELRTAVLNGPGSIVRRQAEYRLWAFAAVLRHVLA